MRFDPDRHRRRSVRLHGYDYAGEGTFFLTICTADRRCVFGEVQDGAMAMNALGWVVWDEWERSADLRKELELVTLVVMPNHLHGVVTIHPTESDAADSVFDRQDWLPRPRAHGRAPLHRPPRSVGAFVAGFKGASTKRINALRGSPGEAVWQRGYYDHIVRSDNDLTRIVYYIDTNPIRWHLDADNPGRDGDDTFDAWLAGKTP